MVVNFEKRRQGLIYVPRYNSQTDSFESTLNLPDATELLNSDKFKKNEDQAAHGH